MKSKILKRDIPFLNYSRLMDLLGVESLDILKEGPMGNGLKKVLKKGKLAHEERWSRSIAVGSREIY